MKNLSLFLSLTLMVACSSTPSVRREAIKKSEPSARETGLVEMTTAKTVTQEPLPPVAIENKTSTGDKLMQQLNDAIQKQDDRGIAISAREILIRDPKNISALNALGLFHFRKGQFDFAKALLNKAIAADSQVSLLYSNLGFIFQSTGEEEDAIKLYRQALKEDPLNAIAAANVGYLYLKRKDFRKAQVAFEMAVERGQRDWKTLSNYGVTLMALGLHSLAQPHLKRAVELQSQNIEVQLNYAILLVEHLNKLPEGLEVLNKIRFMGPGPDLRKKISELENRAKSVLK